MKTKNDEREAAEAKASDVEATAAKASESESAAAKVLKREATAAKASEGTADKTDAAAKASAAETASDTKEEAASTAAASQCPETQIMNDSAQTPRQPPPWMRPPKEKAASIAAVSAGPRLDTGVSETALEVIHNKCEKCEQPVEGDDFVWKDQAAVKKTCGNCNRFKSRLWRVLKGRTELKASWSKMDPEVKKNFFLEQHELVGRDLLACLELTVTKTTTNKNVTEFGSTGDWLDKVCVAV